MRFIPCLRALGCSPRGGAVKPTPASHGPGEETGQAGPQDSETTGGGDSDDSAPQSGDAAKALLGGLSVEDYTEHIAQLSDMGDRTQGSASYDQADAWICALFESWGYEVQRQEFSYGGQPRASIYVTRVGATSPHEMYIISAHLDGRGGGGAADDDGSGVALVLEAARVFADTGVILDRSLRFALWNAEEVGLVGSEAYAAERAALQGQEEPAGSGLYPEPTWLGVIQSDMLLFDHGLPPADEQSPDADVDIEYQASSARAAESLALAEALLAATKTSNERYPAEIGDNMSSTDSVSFEDLCASISLRENRRIDEIGNGSNPHWHQASDLAASYTEDDYALGYDALRMAVGAAAELAGAQLAD